MTNGRIRQALTTLRRPAPEAPRARVAIAPAVGEAVRAELDHLYPGAELVRVDSASALHALTAGQVDAAVFRGPLQEVPETMRVREVRQSPIGVMLCASHRLADRTVLDWPDLLDERLLWFDERRASRFARWLRSELAAVGWTPVLEVRDGVDAAAFDATLCVEPELVSLVAQRDVPDDCRVWIPLAHPLVETLLLAERRRD